LRLLKKIAEGKTAVIQHTIFLSKIKEVILPPEGLEPGTSARSNSQRELGLHDDGIFDRKASDASSSKGRRSSLGSIQDPKPHPFTVTGLKKISKTRDEDGKGKQSEDDEIHRSSSIPMAETASCDQWRMDTSGGSAAIAKKTGSFDDAVPLEVGFGRAFAPRLYQRLRDLSTPLPKTPRSQRRVHV